MKRALRNSEIKTRWFRRLTGPAGVCIFVALFAACSPQSSAQQLTPAWIQLGENGAAIAKVIVHAEDKCPSVEIGNKKLDMARRLPIPNGFPPLCEAEIPRKIRSANVNGQALALPKLNPSIVTVFGDTGCRINATQVQDCNDPAQWPFKQVAASAAAEKPDLMIHVGDYLYRELRAQPDRRNSAATRRRATTGRPGTPIFSLRRRNYWPPRRGRLRGAITRAAPVPGAAGFITSIFDRGMASASRSPLPTR